MSVQSENKLTQYGAEMAMCLRREAHHLDEARVAGERIEELTKLILEEESGTLYGAAATQRMTVLPTARPLRSDRLDGGDTFALNPIGDELTSGSISAIVLCPNDQYPNGPTSCLVTSQHVHTADGRVHGLPVVTS